MRFIDSHCHLHDPRIISDIPWIEDRAQIAGVKYMISCSTMESNFETTANLNRDFHSITPFFGVHPWFIETLSANWKQTLENYLLQYKTGIGETGIDFTDKKANQDLQIDIFKHHLILAKEMNLPVNIHVRNAWDAFIKIIKEIGPFPFGGLIHSYSGSADMIPIFEKQGLYISFSGSITNPGAKKVVKSLKAVSKNRILLETDSPDIYPYLPLPDPETIERSQLNEPGNLPAIAKIAAKRINSDFIEFADNVYNNSLKLFNSFITKE